MKWKTTYIDRAKTNQWVYQHTNTQPISTKITAQQYKFYGHIARAPDTLQYSVVFGPGQLRQLNTLRRVGRPRQQWSINVEEQLMLEARRQGKVVPNRQHLHRLCSDRGSFARLLKRASAAQHADGSVSPTGVMAVGL